MSRFSGKPSRSRMSRRQAFRQMMGRFFVMFDETRGHQHCSLRDLEQTERSKLEELIPIVNRNLEIRFENEWLVCRDPEIDKESRIFQLTKENRIVFNLINGRNSLGRITEVLSDRTGWDNDKAWEHVKQMFLRLLELQACSIANPLND